MKREIELHDSTLKKVVVDDTKTILCFDRAYVHYSEGKPGVDKGTGWAQKINIILHKANVYELPSDLPNDISDSYLIINGKKLQNMFKLPFKAEGKIEIELLTQYNQKLRVAAVKIETEEIGDVVCIKAAYPPHRKGVVYMKH
jgi:hypothetical protein